MIQKITIDHFRSINHAEIVPAHLNVLMGPNGAGKTSRLDAILCALTGRIAASDVQAGAASCRIGLVFDDGAAVTWECSAGGTTAWVDAHRTSLSSAASFIAGKIGTTPEALRTYGGTVQFRSLSARDLSDELLRVLPMSLTMPAILAMASERMQRVLTPEEASYLSGWFDPSKPSYGLADLDTAYRALYKNRTAQNGVVRNLKARLEAPAAPLPTESRDELTTRRKELHAQAARAEVYEREARQWERASAARKTAEERKEAMTAKLKSYGEAPHPDPAFPSLMKGEREQFVSAVVKMQAAKQTAEENCQMYRKILRAMDSHICPISRMGKTTLAPITCQQDLSDYRQALEGLIAKNEETITSSGEMVKRCEGEIRLRDQKMDEWHKAETRANERDILVQSIKAMVIPAVPEKPVRIGMPDPQAVRETEEKLTAYVQADLREKDRKALEQEQHMLDLLEFGVYVTDTKTGIRNLVIQRALKPLHELVNRKAEAFRTGFQVSFRCDNGIEILVCPGTGKELLPLASLSDGEYLFTVYLLMTMLNQVIGARFLIIDNLDKLDAGNTASLLRLMEEDDGFEQIFIGTVDHADTRAALTQAGVTILPLG